MGPLLGALKVGKCDFWENQNGQLRPYSSLEKKVQKTKKFRLIELQLECAKIFGLRSNPGELQPQNHFSGNWPFEADLRQRQPFHAHFPTQWRFFGNFWIPTSSVCIGENVYQFSFGLVTLENV